MSIRVCILFNKNFQLEIIRQYSDQEGRFIIIDMKIDNKVLTLVNTLCTEQARTILLFPQIFSIICSLLNVKKLLREATLIWSWTVQKNKKGGNATTHRNPLKKVQNIANSLDLIDVWRTLNPDGKRFTWRRTKPKVQRRLYYFMISSSLTTEMTFYILPVVGPIMPSLQSTLLVIIILEARVSGNSIHLFCWTASILR